MYISSTEILRALSEIFTNVDAHLDHEMLYGQASRTLLHKWNRIDSRDLP